MLCLFVLYNFFIWESDVTYKKFLCGRFDEWEMRWDEMRFVKPRDEREGEGSRMDKEMKMIQLRKSKKNSSIKIRYQNHVSPCLFRFRCPYIISFILPQNPRNTA